MAKNMNLGYIYNRLLTEVSLAVEPRFQTLVNGRTLSIVGRERAVAHLASDWRPKWKAQLLQRILKLREGAFVDIGANLGQTLLDFMSSASSRRYVGFEPNLKCVEVLTGIVARNGLTNAEIVPAGLSSSTRLQKLFIGDDSRTDEAATMVRDLRPGRRTTVQWVPCFKFDDLTDQLNLTQIAAIKIDVEGFEAEVISGMAESLKRFQPWIICEVLLRDKEADANFYSERSSRLIKLINETNYRVFRILKTADAMSAIRLEHVTEFPNEIWTPERSEQCDYLFAPRVASESELEKLFR
ncbi:FkbM family methyltransferase [Bradyrhizobium manausense]|uniref:FkbM family methyltransferase n=1 Tax=Bradyrhizobium manausense TaxID=989370 RepID=UPI001BAAB8BB|nr:FkbM family methyltransferase [Bradyrhizobium manausense]MBR1092286.1 FkbM family methyltransferase [Bradyrhizobium manausense]